ncbi:M14 family zinc carboxypeptidase [Thalassospira profundimaris]|uniref:M14 family zinc carboxypeptidase n=1 Tax=Thalassospira profundimaris TaxID=502049 RepID=UPI0002872D36|nr:M14 family zinc carboxypeptidase [Thalassospira profundimaris]EKF07966.1 hypothetical protein TH2_10699 [Thalassospira profundimaris WP0211]
MTRIFATALPRTIDTLIRDFATPAHKGQVIEAWLFDDAPSRRAAEAAFAEHGITARIRSSYKPLLHFFLEEIDLAAQPYSDIRVTYPRHEAANDNRFLLETYPLGALVGDAQISFHAGPRTDGVYELVLTDRNGATASHEVFAPNRVHRDMVNETHLSPTGWLRVTDGDGTTLTDKQIDTDYETLFHQTMAAIAAHDWGNQEPYFNELNITVELPGKDHPIAHGHEAISLHEALHEDFYFSLLELFQVKSGRPLGDRGLQPGQIVPEIKSGTDKLTVTVENRALSTTEITGPAQDLDTATNPLTSAQIADELGKIDGDVFTAQSRSGRTISARYHSGTDIPVMISGGQHPNEITGPSGALRAAKALAKRDGAHFTISPLENPDGYALHQRLIIDNPCHMHHAARYTALGDDLEYRTGANLLEKEIRKKAQDISKAQLHVNLHGYPSHEWTRPLSGYVPRGFDMWTLPKGFFLIMRHHDDWTDHANAFIDLVTKHLATIPGLLDFNNAQIELYRTHAGDTGFDIINGFPCMIFIDDRHDVPLTLITEYPDETIYGAEFIAGHTAQMETVIAAYDAHQKLMAQKG